MNSLNLAKLVQVVAAGGVFAVALPWTFFSLLATDHADE